MAAKCAASLGRTQKYKHSQLTQNANSESLEVDLNPRSHQRTYGLEGDNLRGLIFSGTRSLNIAISIMMPTMKTMTR